jgi:hypothetical protein
MPPESALPLTLPEHRELGLEIKRTVARLHELERLVGSVYGPNNQASFSFAKAVEAIDRLQADLESQAAQDLPGFLVGGLYR